MRILIAEDDNISRKLLKTSLEKRGYDVVATKNGVEAWNVLASNDAPQLAILDWMMPEMDGVDVIRHLRSAKMKQYTYIILLTAKGHQDDIATGLEAGADDYLRKPFNAKELHARVRVGQRMIEIQNQLEDHIRRLKELDQLKKDFLAMVSHELRTPLAVMKGGVSLCLDGVAGQLNDTQADLLGDTLENIDQLTRLITDLLDMSKIEAGKIVLRRDTMDLAFSVRKALNAFKYSAGEKGITLKIALNASSLPVYADADKIDQVFNNLISNAIRYTPENKEITLGVDILANDYLCYVADTGIGISDNNLKKLFSKFTQFSRVDGPGYKGTGIGLTIARGLVEKHGGKIWAESKEGEGTTFNFTLKRRDRPTVLIVDDEPKMVDVIEKVLSHGNYHFLKAYSGEEACELAQSEMPAMIVLDMVMPGLDGYGVIDKLKNDVRTQDIPVLILSSAQIEPDKISGENDAGAIPIMTKPVKPKKLIDSVESLIKN
ncbi:response regulator [bacterium]|nr:response regulator [bacterium]